MAEQNGIRGKCGQRHERKDWCKRPVDEQPAGYQRRDGHDDDQHQIG